MLRAGKPIGAITVMRRRPMGFTDNQVALLKTFADQAVIAIENVRLFNETKEALEQQTATAEILRVISSTPTDVQPVFDAIVDSALRIFSGVSVGISIAEGDRLHYVALRGNVAQIPRELHVPRSRESVTGTAVVERAVVNVRDTEAADVPAWARDNARKAGFRGIAAAPMLREGVAIGAIGVFLKEPGGLSEKQCGLLKTFADQAVIAIENTRLFKELQERTEALSRSVGQLTALGEVGQAISSTLDLERVLQTIVTHAVELTGLDAGALYESDEDRRLFNLRASQNIPRELLDMYRDEPVRFGEGAVGGTASTREPIQVADILEGSYQSRARDVLIRSGARALLAVPLLCEGHVLGALAVIRNGPGEFAPEVVALLRTFATQSAIAIQNARLFREIADKGRQLEEASRHKSHFLASMSHELRTPLNAILGFNEMILGEVYGEVPADMKEPLRDIQTSGKHLLRLINNVLDLAKIEAGRMELALADYSVQDMVESVRATLRPLAESKGLELLAAVAESVPPAYGDCGRLTQCLMNLAGNALKFTKTGHVSISVEPNGESLAFRVADTGIGIAPDKLGSLFTEFKQTDATIAREYGGTGLGLSITKRFIEMHGGRIWVESEPGKGSTFIFEIPLRAEIGTAA
jgi:signal transduction histidine kinase